MLERVSKVFNCFLAVRETFGTFWIYGLLFKLFSDLEINGRMWLALKDLYTAEKHSPDICSGTSFFMPSNEKLRCAEKGLVICTTCPLLIFLS